MEELEFYLEEAKEKMHHSVLHTQNEFGKIKAGKANPLMLDNIKIDYYGSLTPLSQVATVSAPDGRSLLIKPWEKKTLPDIQRAIINSDLGFNPQNDGETIRINIPQLTEERRINLSKMVRQEAEHGKVALRNIRKDTNAHIRKYGKDNGISEDILKEAEIKVQKYTDDYSKEIDIHTANKEKDILSI